MFSFLRMKRTLLAFSLGCASGGTTSLAARSVALWFMAPVGFVYSHLYGILLPLFFILASAVICSSLASFS